MDIERRLKTIWVSPECIARMFTLDQGKTIRVVKTSIPRDAEYIDSHYDMQRRGILMCFYHPSFEIVPEGQMVPEVHDTVFEYMEG